MDSATVLGIARHEGYELCALSFRYGQRHVYELECAQRIARAMGVARHEIVEFDLRRFGGSALTSDMAVPKDREQLLSAKTQSIPPTYVPARNTIFLSFALAWAETLQANDLFVGVNALDYSGYPDCRPEYLAAYEKMAQLATKAGVEGARLHIHAPLMKLTTAGIIRRRIRLGVHYALTRRSYDPARDGAPCRRCDSCLLRAKGFAELGVADPLLAK